MHSDLMMSFKHWICPYTKKTNKPYKIFKITAPLLFLMPFLLALANCSHTPNRTTNTPVTMPFTDAKSYLNQRHLIALDQHWDYLFIGINQALSQQKWSDAQTLLLELPFDKLDAHEKALYLFAKAKTALMTQQGQQALSWLTSNAYQINDWFDDLTFAQQWPLIELKSEALEQDHQYFASARILIEAEYKIKNEEKRQPFHDEVWRKLSLIPQDTLENFQQMPVSDYALQGWLELAYLLRTNHIASAQSRLLMQWKTLWADHPAQNPYPQALVALATQKTTAETQTIGLLLPLSGAYEHVASAIINGMMLAFYDDAEHKQKEPDQQNAATLLFYDTNENIPIQALYKKAIKDGATMIIGPLEKKNIEALYSMGNLPVLTLALNALPQSNAYETHKNFYQFGLLIEDEIEQICEEAKNEGKLYGAILYPESELGQRVVSAFEKKWRALDGNVTAKIAMNEKTDVPHVIKQLLQINESEQRAARLEQYLGEKLSFTPKKRADLDFIILATSTDIAKQIKPALAYYFAHDLSVFSTSQIYESNETAQEQEDLNNIRFVDAPWILNKNEASRQNTLSILPARADAVLRLEAFGMDSYHLYQQLPIMIASHEYHFMGASGLLSLTPDLRIKRRMVPVIFENGLPKILPDIRANTNP